MQEPKTIYAEIDYITLTIQKLDARKSKLSELVNKLDAPTADCKESSAPIISIEERIKEEFEAYAFVLN